MTNPELEMQELLDLARDRSVTGRRRLIQVVGDLFFEENGTLEACERRLMAEILQQFIHDVEPSVRRAVADRLVKEKDAPRELVTVLANDEIDVAHNILRNSVVLQDLELIEIIQHRTFEHQLTVAMRDSVSEAVSDALVETGNLKVILTLIENTGAAISGNTMAYLVNESKTREPYQKPLLDRPDFSADLAKRMYWWVPAGLRKYIVEKYSIDPTELDRTIESATGDLLGGPREAVADEEVGSGGAVIDSRTLAQASRPACKLADTKTITPALLLRTLRNGDVRMFECMFARLTGLGASLVRRLICEPGGEGLAIACKAIDMGKPEFGSLFLLSRAARPGDKTVDPTEVARVMKFYDRVCADSAKKVLDRCRRDPDFLFTVGRVEDKDRNRKNAVAAG